VCEYFQRWLGIPELKFPFLSPIRTRIELKFDMVTGNTEDEGEEIIWA
jgi:hypothetical protein